MRIIKGFLMALLLVLLGCATIQEGFNPKVTSDITVGVTGAITWDELLPPDLTINVWNITDDPDEWETSFDAPPAPPDYVDSIKLSVGGDDYEFIPDPPPGYTATPSSIVVENVYGQLLIEDLDFYVSQDQ